MTATLTIYQVDAFADRIFAGNPAAIFILDEWLPDGLMQSIAAENNLSETAFARADGDMWQLRWFAPLGEVDFCGHATLATAHILATEYGASGPMRFRTRAGTLEVALTAGGYRLDMPLLPPRPLEQFPPELDGVFEPGQIADQFRNFENYFAVLRDEDAVRDYKPDFQRIARLGVEGLVITAVGRECDFVSRYFVPGVGIPEDPVTGSIHATLAPYWAEKLGRNTLLAIQASGRKGLLRCDVTDGRVGITGNAVTFMKGEIRLSDGAK